MATLLGSEELCVCPGGSGSKDAALSRFQLPLHGAVRAWGCCNPNPGSPCELILSVPFRCLGIGLCMQGDDGGCKYLVMY